ncbi:hypothetical protein GALMADRAFT_135257 [Galerina marginata CBS 339.88]|uniref:Postreplication repair E3 ubiquitin-protein ligase RAD18 n=1 Tax=Galerina marginata (strain CBS 339.88) TaxID=685588 RepID=A0A067THN8_GALM3|nr:hypothetical protein GALMADRAFT_135257 [Galerina marginata CBS 339.88]
MNFLRAAADIPDPTDFPPHGKAPGLRTLDASLRCDICGELYDAPVTISCGHCFCSNCIRTSLASKQECPSCRKTANEAHIRPNPTLENVISAWKDTRPFILRLIKREEEESGTSSQHLDKGNVRKRKRVTERSSSPNSVLENTAGPSRNPLSSSDPVVPKSPSKSKKLKGKSEDIIDLFSSDADEGEIEAPPNPSNLIPKAEDLVACPLCQKRVRYRILNVHMDNSCKDAPPSENAAESWLKLMGGGKNSHQKGKHKKQQPDSDDEYPLPLAAYTTLKDRQLKDMLVQHDLPLSGDRSNWEQRHRKWVMLFNANLDKSASNRKSKAELRRDLKKWEEEMTKKKKIVITDVKAYQIEHKSEFTRLIAEARPTKQTAAPGRIEALKSSSPSHIVDEAPPQSSSSITGVEENIVVDSENEE